MFSKWAEELELNFSAEACQRLASSFQENFSADSLLLICKQQKILEFNLALHKLLNETNLQLHQVSLQFVPMDANLNTSQLLVNIIIIIYNLLLLTFVY